MTCLLCTFAASKSCTSTLFWDNTRKKVVVSETEHWDLYPSTEGKPYYIMIIKIDYEIISHVECGPVHWKESGNNKTPSQTKRLSTCLHLHQIFIEYSL